MVRKNHTFLTKHKPELILISCIDSIRQSRENYLENVLKLLRQRYEQLRDGPKIYNWACDAMYLGLLIKLNAGDKLPFTQIPKPYTDSIPGLLKGPLAGLHILSVETEYTLVT